MYYIRTRIGRTLVIPHTYICILIILEEADILDEELEEDAAITCPSTMEFRSSLDIVKSYVLFHSEYSHIAAIDSLEELLYTRVVKQSYITDFY